VLKKIPHNEGPNRIPRSSSVTVIEAKPVETGRIEVKGVGKKREVHVDLSTLTHITHVGSTLEAGARCMSGFRKKRQNFRILQRIAA
jgi:hypothetical protein